MPGQNSKKCTKCKVEKPLTDFYGEPRNSDGFRSECKGCFLLSLRMHRQSDPTYLEKKRLWARQYNLEHHESVLARQRRWESSGKGRAYRREWKKSHPDIVRARLAVSNAIQYKKLTKGACEICGAYPAHAHHKDYSRPLDIRWLCPEHHREVHRVQA